MTPTQIFERKFRKPKPGRTLIVGSRVYPGREDRRKLYDNVVGIDMLEGPGVDFVVDLEEPLHSDALHGTAHHIECRSVLEHSRRPWLLAANLEMLLAPGGTLDLSVPFVWRVHAYPSDYFRYTVEGVRSLFPGIEWTALMYVTESTLTDSTKTERISVGGHTYLARSEVWGFGVRK